MQDIKQSVSGKGSGIMVIPNFFSAYLPSPTSPASSLSSNIFCLVIMSLDRSTSLYLGKIMS